VIAAVPLFPLTAGVGMSAMITRGLTVPVVREEGLQGLSQFHANWKMYGLTREALAHEKYLYFAKDGPDSTAGDPMQSLREALNRPFPRIMSAVGKNWQRLNQRIDYSGRGGLTTAYVGHSGL